MIGVVVAPGQTLLLPLEIYLESENKDSHVFLPCRRSVISESFIISMLTLLIMPLAGLHFCVGLDFVDTLSL
jgi:hypothetical protein